MPPEVEARVAGASFDRHHRAWPDARAPALGGERPRGRKPAGPLLKDMESTSARARRAGRPAYDFAWLWGELGLVRPGAAGPLL